jgi:hypothetical protein
MSAPVRWLVGVSATLLLLAGLFVIGLRMTRFQPEAMRAGHAVGDATCISCHKAKATFEATAHRLTSRAPTRAAITGNFSPPDNVFRTTNPLLYFRMDSTADGFYQTAVFGRRPDTTVRSERVDIVTGSGRRGQSFLYWRDDRLYQLPVSHWTLLGWANSPAYPDGRANFDRPIIPRCLECHVAGAEPVADSSADNRYKRGSMTLGLMCETCHGPGKKHVSRERSLTGPVRGPAIINPARMTRARRLDACAVCHGAAVELTSRPFGFIPGQRLEKKLDWHAPTSTGQPDVHGDQVGQLERSKCFTAPQMTCTTCHDVHRQQRDIVELSGKCQQCHTTQSCGLFPTYGRRLEGKCADCHMPVLPSMSVISNYAGRQVRQPIRAHWIKVYPQFRSLPIVMDSTLRVSRSP